MKKYEIWLLNLNPNKWSEQKWIRPCLIVQNNILNNKFSTIIVLPITSSIKNNSSFSIVLDNYETYWLDKKCCILCFQIRVVSKERVIKKIGEINDIKTQNLINQWLINTLDIENLF